MPRLRVFRFTSRFDNRCQALCLCQRSKCGRCLLDDLLYYIVLSFVLRLAGGFADPINCFVLLLVSSLLTSVEGSKQCKVLSVVLSQINAIPLMICLRTTYSRASNACGKALTGCSTSSTQNNRPILMPAVMPEAINWSQRIELGVSSLLLTTKHSCRNFNFPHRVQQ